MLWCPVCEAGPVAPHLVRDSSIPCLSGQTHYITITNSLIFPSSCRRKALRISHSWVCNLFFKYQREIPSPFFSNSTPLFIKTNSRFLSRVTVHCCPWAGAIRVVQQRRNGIICYCRAGRERFCSFFCWKGCFISL